MMQDGGMAHGGGGGGGGPRHNPGAYGMDPSMGMGYGGNAPGYGGMGGGGYGGGAASGGGGGPAMTPDAGGTTILKLRGLPFSVQDEDIVRWFDEASLGISPLTADRCGSHDQDGFPLNPLQFSTQTNASNRSNFVNQAVLNCRCGHEQKHEIVPNRLFVAVKRARLGLGPLKL
jgi:hypothetical protein